MEPDAVVPEAKDAADGETAGEREEETTSVQVEIMAEPENPVSDGTCLTPTRHNTVLCFWFIRQLRYCEQKGP